MAATSVQIQEIPYSHYGPCHLFSKAINLKNHPHQRNSSERVDGLRASSCDALETANQDG